MHVVVVGCGRVGSELALSLERSGHTVAVIDKNADAFRKRLPEDFTGQKVVGFGFDRDHLVEAGIERAGAVAAVTSGDNSNILTARIARENFAIERVVARIYDPRRALIYQRLGIPTVATVSWTTDQVMRRLLPAEEQPHEWLDPSGKVCLLDYPIPAEVGGQEARAAERARRVLARRHHPPRRRAGEHAERDRPGRRHPALRRRRLRARHAARSARARRGTPLMRVAIAGAGNVGLFIANDLRAADHDVLIIEQNPAVVKRAADRRRRHRVARRRRLRGQLAARRRARRAATWSSPRPATTRTTSSSRCSPSRSSRCRA